MTTAKGARWFANLGITVVNTVVVRLIFPTAAVGVAVLATERGWGVLNQVSAPAAIKLVAAVLFLDLAIYLQHVMLHAVPMLWRLHMVHHADVDFDVTTGLRFCPVEIVLSMLIKLGVVLFLGPPVVAVLVFEVLLNATAMFNHGNVRIALSRLSSNSPIIGSWNLARNLAIVRDDSRRLTRHPEILRTSGPLVRNTEWGDRPIQKNAPMT